MSDADKNIHYITLAKVVAAVAVVYLHSNGCFWEFNSVANWWKRSNIIECLFYFAVPIFFMITGITLIDYNKRYGLKEFFLRRFNKTVIPYIFWSLFGLLFNVYFLKSISVKVVTSAYVINGLFSGKIVGIYWFFIALYSIYLCIPLFSSVEDRGKKEVFAYLILVSLLFNSLIPFILKITHSCIKYDFSVGVVSGLIIYPLIGYSIHNYQFSKRLKFVIYIFAILGLVSHIIGTYRLSIEAGKIVKIFKGYKNIPCIFYSTGVFLLIKEYGNVIMQVQLLNKIVNFLGHYTFAIYLVHIYVLKSMVKFFNINVHTILYILFSPIIAVMVSILIAFFIRKVPILKKVLP